MIDYIQYVIKEYEWTGVFFLWFMLNLVFSFIILLGFLFYHLPFMILVVLGAILTVFALGFFIKSHVDYSYKKR